MLHLATLFLLMVHGRVYVQQLVYSRLSTQQNSKKLTKRVCQQLHDVLQTEFKLNSPIAATLDSHTIDIKNTKVIHLGYITSPVKVDNISNLHLNCQYFYVCVGIYTISLKNIY